MKVAYFDAFSGISGDMVVGALVAAGVPIDHLREGLGRLDLHGYSVTATPLQVRGIAAIKFDVHLEDAAHTHRRHADISALIEGSRLELGVKQMALRIFALLAQAEGRVHGVDAGEVTFHEIGAVDSIVDIVAAAIGFSTLGIERAFVSALPGGSGMVASQHGPLPVPAPATVELLRGFALRLGDGEGELVTPTGAAIVAALAAPGPPPPLRVIAVGCGAGSRSLADRPNLLRLMVGEVEAALERDQVAIIETNIDDSSPEIYDFVFERLFAAGALDVSLAAVQMKKNRPGTLLRVICAPADRQRLGEIVLTETSAIGIRSFLAERLKLPREIREVSTEYGPVRVKMSRSPDGTLHAAPEYDDCARIARARGVALKLVYAAAVRDAVR